MKPRVLPSFIRLTLFSAVFVTQAPGQQTQTPPHTRYKLIDLGTFGGPLSRVPVAQRGLTRAGTVEFLPSAVQPPSLIREVRRKPAPRLRLCTSAEAT